MKRAITLVAFAFLIWCVGTAAQKPEHETLRFTLVEKWNAVSHTDKGRTRRITFIREGDDINHWKEIFVYSNGDQMRGLKSPEKEISEMQKDMEKQSPGQTEWNVIAQDENSILVEWHTKWSARTPEERDIMRIIHGKYNWFTLLYAAKVQELTPDKRAQWIKTLLDATISADPSANPQR